MIIWDEKPANVSTIIPYWFDKWRFVDAKKNRVLSTEPLQESLQTRQYWMDLTIPWKLSWRCQPHWMMFIRMIRGIYNYNDRILKKMMGITSTTVVFHGEFHALTNTTRVTWFMGIQRNLRQLCRSEWFPMDPNELLLNGIYVDIDGTWYSRWSKRI